MKVGFALLIAVLSLTTGTVALADERPQIIDLWPGRAPGETADPQDDTVIPPKPTEQPPTLRLTDVTRPQITVYRPGSASNSGVAMLICPGGGFNHLAYDKEGTEVAEWLMTVGITGVVLKYRCPTRHDPVTQHLKPLQDAQQAMRLIDQHAGEWNIDREKIGVCGFSAGGKVAALVATNWDQRSGTPGSSPPASTATEPENIRPAFAILLYPALSKEAKEGLDVDGIRITPDTPTSFIAYSADDKHPTPGALHLAIALAEAGVSCELHQYATGGHGYGLRPNDHDATTWPARLKDWLQANQLIAK